MKRCDNKKMYFSKGNVYRQTCAELVSENSARVFAICFSMLNNREDAEDITQQAFLKGYSDIKQLRDINKFGAWITQIAKHIFDVPKVICRIYDPLRQELYSTLGLETFSPTTIFAQLLKERLET